MKLSDEIFNQKDIIFSKRKIINSNSSSYLRVGKINLESTDFKEINRRKKNRIFSSFLSSNEDTNYNSNTNRGLDSEIYERLRNENVDFIKTLLRLKQKMYNQSLLNQEKQKFKNINNEKIENLKMMKNNIISPLEIKSIQNSRIIKKEKPIIIKNSIKKVNYIENKKKETKNFFHNKIDNSLKTSKTSIHSTPVQTNMKTNSPYKINKQRAVSEIPNNQQINKIKQLMKTKKTNINRNKNNQNKSISSSSIISINMTYDINNNNPNKNVIKKLKENKKKSVPKAVINLFDDFDEINNNKIKGKSEENKFHFTHKRIKTNY